MNINHYFWILIKNDQDSMERIRKAVFFPGNVNFVWLARWRSSTTRMARKDSVETWRCKISWWNWVHPVMFRDKSLWIQSYLLRRYKLPLNCTLGNIEWWYSWVNPVAIRNIMLGCFFVQTKSFGTMHHLGRPKLLNYGAKTLFSGTLSVSGFVPPTISSEKFGREFF